MDEGQQRSNPDSIARVGQRDCDRPTPNGIRALRAQSCDPGLSNVIVHYGFPFSTPLRKTFRDLMRTEMGRQDLAPEPRISWVFVFGGDLRYYHIMNVIVLDDIILVIALSRSAI